MKMYFLFIFLPLIILGQSQSNKVHYVYKDGKTSVVSLYFYSCNYNQEIRKKKIAPSILKKLQKKILIGCRKPSDYYITKKIEEDKYQFYYRDDKQNIWLSYYIKIGKENGKYYVKPEKITLVNDNKVLKPWDPDLVEKLTDDSFIRLIGKLNSNYLNEAIETISTQIGHTYTLSEETETYIESVFNYDADYEPGAHQVTDFVKDAGSELIRIYYETLNDPSVQNTDFIAPSVLNKMPKIFKLHRYKKTKYIYIISKDTTGVYMVYHQNSYGSYSGNHLHLTEESGNLYIKPTNVDLNNYESLYAWDRVIRDYYDEEEFLTRLKSGKFDDKFTFVKKQSSPKKYADTAKFTDINIFARTSKPQRQWEGKNRKVFNNNDWLSPYKKEQLKKAWDNYRNNRSIKNGVCPVCGGTGKTYSSKPKTVIESKITDETDYSYTVQTTTRKVNWYRQHKCSRCNGTGK